VCIILGYSTEKSGIDLKIAKKFIVNQLTGENFSFDSKAVKI